MNSSPIQPRPVQSANSNSYRLLLALVAGAAIAVVLMLLMDKPDATAPAASSVADGTANAAAHPMAAPTAAGGSKADSIDVLVERLQARLQNAPNDVDGWVLLGRSYHYLQRWDDATGAFKKARELGWQGEAPALDASSGGAGMQAAPAADPVFQGVQQAVQQQSSALQSQP